MPLTEKLTKAHYFLIILVILFFVPFIKLIYIEFLAGIPIYRPIDNLISLTVQYYLMLPLWYAALSFIAIVITIIAYKKFFPYIGVKDKYKLLYAVFLFYIIQLYIAQLILLWRGPPY